MCKVISTLKKKKLRRQGMNCRTFSQISCRQGKSHQCPRTFLRTVSVNLGPIRVRSFLGKVCTKALGENMLLSFQTYPPPIPPPPSPPPRMFGQISAQTLLRCPYTPTCNCMHLRLCASLRSRSSYQSLVDYGNTKTPSMHCRLVARLCRSGLSPGKATRVSYGRNPIWTNQI